MSKSSNRRAWVDALTKCFEQEYASHPLPDREQLSPAEAFQCHTVGGTVLSWLEERGPELLHERALLAEMRGEEDDPVIVFISDSPGLVAAQQILSPRPPSIFYLPVEAFWSFIGDHPDDSYQWHVVYLSTFIDELSPDTLERAWARYELQPSEQYLLHKETSMLGELFACGAEHLWKWDGQKATLLEEAFVQWAS